MAKSGVTVSVFGLGRIGLVMAACMAKKGYRVLGIDPDHDRLMLIQKGKTPFFEPRLRQYVTEGIRKARLQVTTDASENNKANVAFVSVGTPARRNGDIDLTYIRNATHAIGQSLRSAKPHQLVVVKSTVTPGTARKIVKPILEQESGKKTGTDFHLLSNPEFMREGNAIHDMEFPDRIVIGSEDRQSIKRLERFYAKFYHTYLPPMIRTTHENAELIKYANNAFLANKISFINCIASIAERIRSCDVRMIAAGIGLDKRIGKDFLDAGLGWGGSCLPKDISALARLSKTLGYEPRMINATIRTNQLQWRRVIKFAREELGSLKDKRIAILGLAFKPNTDDLREALSIKIIKALHNDGARIAAYDPAALRTAHTIFKDTIVYVENPLDCIHQCDCCIVVTEWDSIRRIPASAFKEQMRRPLVIDGRRLYNEKKFSREGVELKAIGLGRQN